MRIESEYVEFADINELNQELDLTSTGVIEGLELASDIVNASGGVLYREGSEFGERQDRKLRRLLDDYDQAYTVRIALNQALTAHFVELIQADMGRVEAGIRNRKSFAETFAELERIQELCAESLKESPTIATHLFRVRSAERGLRAEPLPALYKHALFRTIMALVTMEMMKEHCEDVEVDPGQDGKEVVEASLAWHIAMEAEYEAIRGADKRRRRAVYQAAVAKISPGVRRLELSAPIETILDSVVAYNSGDATVATLQTRTALLANIVIGIEQFVQMTGGFFCGSLPLKETFDRILRMGIRGKLHRSVVEALAKGFPNLASFDFYSELDSILDDCEFRSGHPHPMRCLQSATLVLCGTRDNDCTHYGGDAGRPVLIAKDDETGLAPGSYGACQLMTPRLKGLYDRYYTEIKAGVTTERNTGFMNQEHSS